MHVKILNSNAKYTRAKSETEICTIHQVHIDSFFVISVFWFLLPIVLHVGHFHFYYCVALFSSVCV